MKVLLYGTNNAPLLNAMAEGITALGHTVQHRNGQVYREGEENEPCDAGALFSLHGTGAGVLRDFKKNGIPLVVVDYGYVRRGTPHEGRSHPGKYYFSVGLNGLNGHADFKNHLMPGDRWEALGVPLKPWKTDGKYIILCGQKTHDAAIGNIVPRVWAQQVIKQIQEITNRPVIFRPHPMDPSQKRQIGVPHDEHHSLEEALRDAYCVVSYNSNSLVESIVNGVPAFALGPGSMVEGVCNKDLSQIENPQRLDRQQWAYNLSYTQWSIDEMRQGLPWAHLFEGTPSVSEPALEPITVKQVEPELKPRRGQSRKDLNQDESNSFA